MEKDAADKEVDGVTDTDEETPHGGTTSVTCSSQWEDRETNDGFQQEEKTAHQKSQDNQNPAMTQDSVIQEADDCGSAEAKEDVEDEEGCDGAADHDNFHVINQEEDEAAKEQHLNGGSGWRNEGAGRRFKLRGGGLVPEQASHNAFPFMQKSNVAASGGRHKQSRRRNHHHHHQHGRGRRRSGKQLFLAFREMLSESVSVWCVSCVHMMIEIIVTLTHNCGVGVETGGVKAYNFVQHLLVKVTDVAEMKADTFRIFQRTKCIGMDLVDKLLRSAKWTKTAALSGWNLLRTLIVFGSHWGKGMLVRLVSGEKARRCRSAFLESRFWKRVTSLMEKVLSGLRRDGPVPPSFPGSPNRSGRGQPGQELERLLALSEVPEDELDPFAVLGVEVHATDAELKKAYRQLAVQVCGKDSGFFPLSHTSQLMTTEQFLCAKMFFSSHANLLLAPFLSF